MKFKIVVAALFITNVSFGQTQFITQGKITFERRVSQFKMNQQEGQEDNVWDTEMKKVLTKVLVDQYTLDFTPTQTYYHLTKENSDNKYLFGNIKPIESNYVLQDFTTGTTQMLRNVFDSEYNLKDSLKKFEWKLTAEVREIAGFECKKAVTKICDSVVVVAFYTDQIPVKAGPENFNGLPGMILGLAIPRLASTWFATKLELVNIPIPAPISTKSKKVSWTDINKELNKGTKSWGKEAAVFLWVANL
jgi:GLPGLI family protein